MQFIATYDIIVDNVTLQTWLDLLFFIDTNLLYEAAEVKVQLLLSNQILAVRNPTFVETDLLLLCNGAVTLGVSNKAKVFRCYVWVFRVCDAPLLE